MHYLAITFLQRLSSRTDTLLTLEQIHKIMQYEKFTVIDMRYTQE